MALSSLRIGLLAVWPALVLAQTKAPPTPSEPTPRWADGHVNLGSTPEHKGYWEVRPGLGGFPRPDAIPFQPWARAVYDYRQKTNSKDSPLVACKAAGGPSFFNAPGFEFVEVPEQKVIFILNIAGPHSWRVIHMDGRPHPSGDELRPTFLGHSTGRWEGDTLVIDTVGIKVGPYAMIDWYGTPHSPALHVVERYRLLDYDAAKDGLDRDARENYGPRAPESAIEPYNMDTNYRGKYLQNFITVEDPGVFATPWSATVTYGRPLSEWLENVCADNPRKYGTEKDAQVPTAEKPDF